MRRILLAGALLACAFSTGAAEETGSATEAGTPVGGLGIRGSGKPADEKPRAASRKPPGKGEAVVLGSIDKDGIRKVIQDHADEIRGCYEEELARDPQVQGRIVVKWIIQANGSATNATVERTATTVSSDALLGCVTSRVETWTFPRPNGGGIAVITYPWTLRTATPADVKQPSAP